MLKFSCKSLLKVFSLALLLVASQICFAPLDDISPDLLDVADESDLVGLAELQKQIASQEIEYGKRDISNSLNLLEMSKDGVSDSVFDETANDYRKQLAAFKRDNIDPLENAFQTKVKELQARQTEEARIRLSGTAEERRALVAQQAARKAAVDDYLSRDDTPDWLKSKVEQARVVAEAAERTRVVAAEVAQAASDRPMGVDAWGVGGTSGRPTGGAVRRRGPRRNLQGGESAQDGDSLDSLAARLLAYVPSGDPTVLRAEDFEDPSPGRPSGVQRPAPAESFMGGPAAQAGSGRPAGPPYGAARAPRAEDLAGSGRGRDLSGRGEISALPPERLAPLPARFGMMFQKITRPGGT